MVNQCLTSPDSGHQFAPPLNDWRSETASTNTKFCQLPSRILVPTMCTHCCIPVVTPALTVCEFQEWKCSAYINCHTTNFSAWQSFLYHYHCTYTYPLNSMIKSLLHHLLHVTSISQNNVFFFFNYSHGNLTYWIGFVHKLSLGDNVEEYTDSIFCWTVKIVTIDEETFQPNIHNH
jgi:hypothetical protein